MTINWLAPFFFLCLLSTCLAVALPDPFPRAKFGSVIESRELCYDDDVLWSFQYWSHDSIPFCSSLLGIEDTTVTADPTTSYTYVPPLPS